MVGGDGDVHTAHRLLAGAIEAGDHGWRADDAALDEALHTLLLLSSYAGDADRWAFVQQALARLTPEPGDILSVLSRTLSDPVRTGAAALPGLEALLASLPHEREPARVTRIGTASLCVDRFGECREHFWRMVRRGREEAAPRRHLAVLMHLCLDDLLTGRWDEAEELAFPKLGISSRAALRDALGATDPVVPDRDDDTANAWTGGAAQQGSTRS